MDFGLFSSKIGACSGTISTCSHSFNNMGVFKNNCSARADRADRADRPARAAGAAAAVGISQAY